MGFMVLDPNNDQGQQIDGVSEKGQEYQVVRIFGKDRHTGLSRVMPDGLTAAHRLGLTNTVPAKVVYWTDGSTRAIPVGNRTIHLKHVRPGLIRWAHHAAAPVVSAMMWLGPSLATDSSMLDRLSQRLPLAVIKDLADGLSTLPAWAAPIAREITTPHRIDS